MWRVVGSSFRLLSTVQPSISGRKMSSEIAVGLNSLASESPTAPRVATIAFEAFVSGQAEQDSSVVRIVFDDQQHGVAGFDTVAIIGDDFFDGRRARMDRERRAVAVGIRRR